MAIKGMAIGVLTLVAMAMVTLRTDGQSNKQAAT